MEIFERTSSCSRPGHKAVAVAELLNARLGSAVPAGAAFNASSQPCFRTEQLGRAVPGRAAKPCQASRRLPWANPRGP